MYKNRSGRERGDPRIIPPLRNRPTVCKCCDICDVNTQERGGGGGLSVVSSLYKYSPEVGFCSVSDIGEKAWFIITYNIRLIPVNPTTDNPMGVLR